MPALPTLDLPRFMGRWWVIANIPYFAERGKLASSDTYALREDGGIDVTYAWKKSFEETQERSIGARAACGTCMRGNRNTEFRAEVTSWIFDECQMRHRDDFEIGIENAVNFIAIEI